MSAATPQADTPVDDIVAIEDLRVTFATDGGAVRAVDGVSIAVRPREIVA
jgi:peptide/nickel transport system ATP-binding protein